MADSNTSLPVRTQNNGDVKVNVADGTTESQLLGVDSSGRVTVKLDDGAGNIITSQVNGSQRALDVGIDVAGVQVDPRAIRALTSADIVTVDQGTSPWVENLSQVGGTAIALGQTTMAASLPVTIASNQTALPVTQSTSPWVTSDLADGSVTGGTAGTKSLLSGAIYNSTAPTLTNGQQASLQLNSAGALNVNVTTPIPAGTNIIGKVEVTDGTNIQGVTAASTAASATQPAAVVALSPNSPLPAGTNALGSVLANLQVSNAAVTVANPVPVTITSASAGTPIQNYMTSAALAAGSSVTLTYTIPTGHTFSLERVWVSASGKIKTVVQNGSNTIYAAFNSTATPNIDITVTAPPTISSAGTVNVIITNNDLLPFDVYATVEGNQIT